jgi:hypothetical protein
MPKPNMSRERLLDLFQYDEETGQFLSRVNTGIAGGHDIKIQIDAQLLRP